MRIECSTRIGGTINVLDVRQSLRERGHGNRPAKDAVLVDRKEIELPPFTDRGDK